MTMKISAARAAAMAFATGLAGLALPAAAQDIYVSAGAGLARYTVVCGAAGPCDKSDTGWRLAASSQADPTSSAGLIYLRTGSVKVAGNNVAGKAEASGLGLVASYRYEAGARTLVTASMQLRS